MKAITDKLTATINELSRLKEEIEGMENKPETVVHKFIPAVLNNNKSIQAFMVEVLGIEPDEANNDATHIFNQIFYNQQQFLKIRDVLMNYPEALTAFFNQSADELIKLIKQLKK